MKEKVLSWSSICVLCNDILILYILIVNNQYLNLTLNNYISQSVIQLILHSYEIYLLLGTLFILYYKNMAV